MKFERLSQQGGRARRAPGVSRRDFLKFSAVAGGGLTVSVFPLSGLAAGEGGAEGVPKGPVDPTPFIRIHPDNTIEVLANRLEFGQGSSIGLAMIVAEELDADWAQVRPGLAPAGAAYKDPVFGIQMTGGSTAIAHGWRMYREIGATTRAMLIAAAAERWKLPASACSTRAGFVLAGGRRASYGSLAEAAARQPLPQQVALKPAREFRLVGQARVRSDAAAVAAGRKRFGVDMQLPGLCVALLLRAPTFGGTVESFDAEPARAVKGFRAALKVATDRGGSGVAVIADGYWQAKKARDLVAVQWKDGPQAGLLDTDAIRASYREALAQPKLSAVEADMSALAKAKTRVVAEYEFPYLAHAPMEPLNATLQLEAGQATIWAGSQMQTVDHGVAAKVLGLPPDKVRLNTLPAGGSFGRRATPTADWMFEAATIAKAWQEASGGRPVALKVMWSREDDIRGGYYRPMTLHRAEIGLDDKGEVLAWDHAVVSQSILKGSPFEGMLKDGVDFTATEGIAGNTYGLPLRLRVTHPELPVPVLWLRSVGHTHTGFVMETLVDELARGAGQDPVDWRLRHLDAKKHARHIEALKLAVEKSGYRRAPRPAEGHAWGVAVHESFDSVVAYVVDVSLKDGRPVVHRVVAGVHAGTVVNPLSAEAQIQGAIVLALGALLPGHEITFKAGRVQQSQFSDFPPPRLTDAPAKVEVHFVPSDAAPTGLGEPGYPALAPAVANAVAALSGKRLRRLPFTA